MTCCAPSTSSHRWSDGAAPGAPHGSAVLVGHTVRNNGGGIFADVGTLHNGRHDRGGGSNALTYRVQSVDVLSKDQVARDAEQIFTQAGPGRLVVITCDDWDGTTSGNQTSSPSPPELPEQASDMLITEQSSDQTIPATVAAVASGWRPPGSRRSRRRERLAGCRPRARCAGP